MKYIAYYIPEIIPDEEAVILKYQCVPRSEAAIRELNNMGAQILGEYKTEKDCLLRAQQHTIALDGLQCLN